MACRPRRPLADGQMSLLWERWKQGESLHQSARLSDRRHCSIRRVLAQTGGIRPALRHRSARALTLAEREEISRSEALGHLLRDNRLAISEATSDIIARSGDWTDGCPKDHHPSSSLSVRFRVSASSRLMTCTAREGSLPKLFFAAQRDTLCLRRLNLPHVT